MQCRHKHKRSEVITVQRWVAKIYFGNGTTGGINIKHFLNKTAALEGSLLFATGALGIEGLYEYHGNITGAPGLKWYAGAGGIIAFST